MTDNTSTTFEFTIYPRPAQCPGCGRCMFCGRPEPAPQYPHPIPWTPGPVWYSAPTVWC